MNNNLTEIVFILDRSGSMDHLTYQTIEGFNSFLKEQKAVEGDAVLTTILFDDRYEILHNHRDLQLVDPITTRDYYTRGTTALLDAIGKTVTMVDARIRRLNDSKKPDKVLFVITTDGMENASIEYTADYIKEMVLHHTKDQGWQFIFLGANIDSITVGNNLGINLSANYSANSVGTRSVYNTVTQVSTQYRSKGTVDPDWNKGLK